MKKKYLDENELIKKVLLLKKNKKKISHCHGVFDLLHWGHIKHFEEAKSLSDILIVTITTDKYVNKGPNRPFYNELQRIEAIAALKFVDYVYLNDESSSTNVIKLIKPNYYCKGPDYKNFKDDITNKIKSEHLLVKKFGGKLYISKAPTFSSSSILNKYFNTLNKNQKKNIILIKKNTSLNMVKDIFKRIQKLKVLVIGELIIDEYNFCDAVGKSGKDPIMVFKDLYTERYIGGAGAVANHLSSFCDKIDFLTTIGTDKNQEKFIKKNFKKNINLKLIYKKNSPTITKKRIIDKTSNNKAFGIYKFEDEELSQQNKKKFINYLKEPKKKYDLILVSDFGHGFIDNDLAIQIRKSKKFISANAQLNSSNKGYHNLNKYKSVDCMVINEAELRYELRDNTNKVELLMKKLKSKLKVANLIVTRGSKGVIFLKKDKYHYCEAFSTKVVDKVGAGDSLLSMISLCIKSKVDINLSLLLSSLVAAYNVENIGNSKIIEKEHLLKTISHIIK